MAPGPTAGARPEHVNGMSAVEFVFIPALLYAKHLHAEIRVYSVANAIAAVHVQMNVDYKMQATTSVNQSINQSTVSIECPEWHCHCKVHWR